MKRKWTLFLIIAVVCTSLIGCVTEEKTTEDTTMIDDETERIVDKEEYIIGVSMSAFDEFGSRILSAMEEKAREYPNVKLIILNARGDAEKQVNDVGSLFRQNVDGIILQPVDQEEAADIIDEIKATGIPLVEVNRTTKNTNYDVYVGHDDVKAGILQGEFIKRTVEVKIKLGIIHGTIGSSPQIKRYQGLRQSLIDACPDDVEVLAKQSGEWSREGGLRITKEWIELFPKMNVIVAQNDPMAAGAVVALETAGKLDDVVVVGVDATQEALRLIKEGKMEMTALQDAHAQGSIAIEVTMGLLQGKTYEKKRILPYIEITHENVDEYLD